MRDVMERAEENLMKIKINAWGRAFKIDVLYEWIDKNDEILESQREAVQKFEIDSEELLKDPEPVKKYIEKTDGSQIDGEVGNIFYYCIPRALFVRHEEKNPQVVLMCDYRFDEENGINLVFDQKKLVRICREDEI